MLSIIVSVNVWTYLAVMLIDRCREVSMHDAVGMSACRLSVNHVVLHCSPCICHSLCQIETS